MELFRKRLIPDECVKLKDDIILYKDQTRIVTKWETLHAKLAFSHGMSLYCIEEGFKISRFFKEGKSQCYIYCDIIDTDYNENDDSYIFTDLLADVIIENDGFVRVVDIDELADAHESGILSDKQLTSALRKLNKLLSIIYSDNLKPYLDFLDKFSN